ncbi:MULTISPECIES: hypothetical protein [Caulobacteraceae]|jgi:hypothetical protein|uniref:hypothetical protein n=1 Tax=Caulobacteraceae TaxID=76892 RepID=UPI0029F1688C|nr:hypothetical protein [Phenylobacterium sp.]MDZ4318727.1 hypothetical protein [Phenylobacterium sp.]
MSLSLAQRSAWSLAKTLMVCVTLFKAGSGFGVMPSSEFDGEPESIVHEYDPWA